MRAPFRGASVVVTIALCLPLAACEGPLSLAGAFSVLGSLMKSAQDFDPMRGSDVPPFWPGDLPNPPGYTDPGKPDGLDAFNRTGVPPGEADAFEQSIGGAAKSKENQSKGSEDATYTRNKYKMPNGTDISISRYKAPDMPAGNEAMSIYINR